MITNKLSFVALACTFFAVAAASQLRAELPNAPITGGPTLGGDASVSFAMNMTIVNFSNDFFLIGSGTYAGIPQTQATFTSFCFTGDGTNAVLCAPVPMLWAFTYGGNSYSFDLLSLTSAHVESNALTFTGSGVLHATGFDPTPANFGMTGSGPNFNDQFFSFVGNVVPEPGSLVLAGFGLMICGAVAYFRCRRGTL